jgi:hypothetical protein
MVGFPTANGRVTGSKYLALPDGHRTTFVTGMSDMLNYALLFTSEERKPQLKELLNFMHPMTPDALRKSVDEWLSADISRQEFLMAGCFATCLLELCSSNNKK